MNGTNCKDEPKINFLEHQYGFIWGGLEVKRICSDNKKGWVLLGIKTRKKELQIYITKTGKIAINTVDKDFKEWKEQ